MKNGGGPEHVGERMDDCFIFIFFFFPLSAIVSLAGRTCQLRRLKQKQVLLLSNGVEGLV